LDRHAFSHSEIITMRILSISATLAALLLPHTAQAHDIKHGNLQIVHPWAHQSGAQNASTAGVYMLIRNLGQTPDRLVSASTARAGQVNLVASPQGGFVIKPGQARKLSVKTGYVRLHGLKKPLYAHDNFPLTLVFEKAGRVDVEVQVEEAHIQQPHKH
jgi:periplasmic copper chaperone A